MTSRPPEFLLPRRLSFRAIAWCCLCTWLHLPVLAAEAARSFDIPAGAADQSLQQFSRQSGLEVVFGTATAVQIKTNAVKGSYAPQEAMTRLLDGTGLVAVVNPRTGALTVSCDPNDSRVAPMTSGDRPGTSSDRRSAADEAIALSPFTVNADADKGYLASTAISGTKTNTALKDMPINIAVVTEEMLKDLNVLVPTDALQYTAAVTVTENVASQLNPLNFGGGVTIRGTGTFYNLRNGFRSYDSPSAISVQRIEVLKGPASVLYGVTKPGGAVNYITKTPTLGRSRGSVNFSYGSFDTTRTTLDLNEGRLMGGKLGFRIASSYADVNAKWDYSEGWEKAWNPSVVFQPFTGTQITLEYDWVFRTRQSQRTPFLSRSVTGYLGSSVPDFIYPTGPDDPVARLSPALPGGFTPDFNPRGDAEDNNVSGEFITLGISQKLAEGLDLNVQVQRNRHLNITDGFGFTAEFAGTQTNFPYPRFSRQWQYTTSRNHIVNEGVTALYKRELRLPWVGATKHKVVVGLQRMSENYESDQLLEYVPGTATRFSYYVPLSPTTNVRRPSAFPGGEVRRNLAGVAREDNDFDLGFVSWSGELLNGRAILNGGVTRLLFTQVRAPGTGTGIVTDARANSPLVGAIVRPVPQIGVFVQSSRSINPNTSARDGWDQSLPPEVGKGSEIGLKWELFGGRLAGTLGVFRIKELNRSFQDGNAPNKDSFYLDETGAPHVISGPDDPRYNPNLAGQKKGARVAAGEAISEGFDTDMVFSVNRQFQFTASYAYLDSFVSRDLNNSIATMVGRALPNAYYHKGAMLGKYRFTEGRLKGFDVMLGVNWRSRIVVDVINTGLASAGPISAPVPRYAKPLLGGDFKLGYARKVFGRSVTFALNVANLFEAEQRTGWIPKAGTYADTPYYFKLPRTFTLSSGLGF
jgi:iron complex outermembrane receptor protein